MPVAKPPKAKIAICASEKTPATPNTRFHWETTVAQMKKSVSWPMK